MIQKRCAPRWPFRQGLLQFCDLVNDLKARSRDVAPSELIQQVMEKSGYVSELIADGTDEAEERRRNLQELVNAALQYQEENDEGDLEGFWPRRLCPACRQQRHGSRSRHLDDTAQQPVEFDGVSGDWSRASSLATDPG